jgi:hypothetical protein
LQVEDTQQLIISAVDLMTWTAMKLINKKNDPKPQLAIQADAQDREDENADEDDQPKTLGSAKLP